MKGMFVTNILLFVSLLSFAQFKSLPPDLKAYKIYPLQKGTSNLYFSFQIDYEDSIYYYKVYGNNTWNKTTKKAVGYKLPLPRPVQLEFKINKTYYVLVKKGIWTETLIQ